MRKSLMVLAFAAVAITPLAAQTPARPAARARRADPVAPAPDKFDAIRERYRKQLDADRAALQRTRDRMREELTAAGWRPARGMRHNMMRTRQAGFRAPARPGRPGRMARNGGMGPMRPMRRAQPMEPMQPMQPMRPMRRMQPMQPTQPMQPMQPMQPGRGPMGRRGMPPPPVKPDSL